MSTYMFLIVIAYILLMLTLSLSFIKKKRRHESYKVLKNDYSIISNNDELLSIHIKYKLNDVDYFFEIGDLEYGEKVKESNYNDVIEMISENKKPTIYVSNEENRGIYTNPLEWIYIKDYSLMIGSTAIFIFMAAVVVV